jgi:hypothetical protein
MAAMDPRATLLLPDGSRVEAASEALLGRSTACAIRIDDARVSTVHAELSWRDAGLVLIARGGRVMVDGRGVREVVLTPDLAFELAPGLVLRVLDVTAGKAPTVATTEGRERLWFVVGPDAVKVSGGPSRDLFVMVSGVGARILARLLDKPGGLAWDAVAEVAWPEDGQLRRDTREGRVHGQGRWTETDERRFRNRWDQQVTALRKQLAGVRGGLVVAQRGVVELVLHPTDAIESPDGTVRVSRTPNENTADDGSEA